MLSILNKRSSVHPNWCEDNYWVVEEEDLIVGAVLDGCSTGINSHFASQFVKYVLEYSWTLGNPYNHPYIMCCTMARRVIGKMSIVSRQLSLTDMNFLSTIVFFTYNKRTKELYVMFFGDGVVYVNGEEFIHDEQNAPQYPAYHMNDTPEQIDGYLSTRKTMEFSGVEDFSICTDGVHSLYNVRDGKIPQSVAIDYLVKDRWAVSQKTGLARKFNILTNRNPATRLTDETYCWDLKDDLTIIRYATV